MIHQGLIFTVNLISYFCKNILLSNVASVSMPSLISISAAYERSAAFVASCQAKIEGTINLTTYHVTIFPEILMWMKEWINRLHAKCYFRVMYGPTRFVSKSKKIAQPQSLSGRFTTSFSCYQQVVSAIYLEISSVQKVSKLIQTCMCDHHREIKLNIRF